MESKSGGALEDEERSIELHAELSSLVCEALGERPHFPVDSVDEFPHVKLPKEKC